MHFRFLSLALLAVFALLIGPNAAVAQQAPPIVRAIEIQYAGPATVSREKILANMRTQVGRPYSQDVVEEDIRNLYSSGNISNVRIFGEPAQDGVKVTVVVAAQPQISAVSIQGATRIKESRLRKELTVKPSDALNEGSLEQDRQKLQAYYAGRGFTETEVRYDIVPDEQAGTAKVVFTVNEGGKTTIKSIKFEGNSALTDKELSKAITTKRRSIFHLFSQAGRLNNEQLDQDVLALRDYYQNRGYIDVQIGAPVIGRSGDNVEITFPITEGQQYRVGNVTYSGINVFTTDEVVKNLKTKTGAIYSPAAVRGDITTIQNLYGSRGYIDFQAGANTTSGGPQVIDIAYQVDEGVQTYVEKINITGNARTKDKVIRREIAVAPGDIFNTVRVDSTKARLMGTNYFAKVETYPSPTLVPGRQDLNVIVEEKRTGSFNFGAGFSSIDNLLGFAEITQSNFDITRYPYFTGGGQRFRMRLQYGVRRKDFIISLTEPYFLDYKLQVSAEAFYRQASFTSDVYDEERLGFDLSARKYLTDFTFVRFGYRLENISINNVDEDASDVIKEEEGTRLKSMINAGVTYDTRDSYFLTRKGERVSFGAYVAGGPLGGDTDIYGFELEGSKYFLLPGDTILTLNGEVSVVDAWADGTRVPIFDRLYAGGANNLRGFRFRDVGPKDDDGEPIGGNTLARATIEYTFPVIEKIRGAVFYDVGFVSADSYKFSPQTEENGSGGLNQDVGIGVRLDLPIGPVRIDYGIPLQSDRFNDSSGKFNFNIGYQF